MGSNKRSISKPKRFRVFRRDRFRCRYCGAEPWVGNCILQVDHIKPVSKGGGNEMENLATACEACNRGKSTLILTDDEIPKPPRPSAYSLDWKPLSETGE